MHVLGAYIPGCMSWVQACMCVCTSTHVFLIRKDTRTFKKRTGGLYLHSSRPGLGGDSQSLQKDNSRGQKVNTCYYVLRKAVQESALLRGLDGVSARA